jgi:hypothetical protein
MEGVLVGAQKDGSTFRIIVFTDAQGRYSFPATKLEPGHYSLRVRAVGYDLTGAASADVAVGSAATANLKLIKTKNLSGQLNNAEWMASVPESPERRLLLSSGA